MEKESKNNKFVASKEQPQKSAEPMSYGTWFSYKVSQKRKVQAHHYDAIFAFFQNCGLSENETAQDYDAALKIFGY